jgi:hypothetical protein
MKRDLVLIIAYIAFLIAMYELQAKYMEKSEKRALDFEQEFLETLKKNLASITE